MTTVNTPQNFTLLTGIWVKCEADNSNAGKCATLAGRYGTVTWAIDENHNDASL
jgi:hypothetical protein